MISEKSPSWVFFMILKDIIIPTYKEFVGHFRNVCQLSAIEDKKEWI